MIFLYLREVLENGSLHFPPFSLNDYRSDIHSGIYLCSLSNSVGTIISRECHLHSGLYCFQDCALVHLHTIGTINIDIICFSDDTLPQKLQASSIFVLRSNTALLRCSQPNIIRSKLFQIAWFKVEDSEGWSLLKHGGKYGITVDGDLLVHDVSESDASAKFFCKLSNKLTGKSLQSQYMQVILIGKLILYNVIFHIIINWFLQWQNYGKARWGGDPPKKTVPPPPIPK